MPNIPLVEISAILLHETEKAYYIDTGDKKVWVPKSMVEAHTDNIFEMPEWLAKEKEII